MGSGKLADIARDLVTSLCRDFTTDRVSRGDVRAKLRSTIKRLLVVYGYPPDVESRAVQYVLDPDGDLRRGVVTAPGSLTNP